MASALCRCRVLIRLRRPTLPTLTTCREIGWASKTWHRCTSGFLPWGRHPSASIWLLQFFSHRCLLQSAGRLHVLGLGLWLLLASLVARFDVDMEVSHRRVDSHRLYVVNTVPAVTLNRTVLCSLIPLSPSSKMCTVWCWRPDLVGDLFPKKCQID